jgi:hypothetical protein
MQTNSNVEKKQIIEIWDWHDGWGKSKEAKKVYRKIRKAKEKENTKKMIREMSQNDKRNT